MEYITIPTKEAVMALDIASSYLMKEMPVSVALNQSANYMRFASIYRLNGIKGKFAQSVLDLILDEGQRQMMSRQPVHVRFCSTMKKGGP